MSEAAVMPRQAEAMLSPRDAGVHSHHRRRSRDPRIAGDAAELEGYRVETAATGDEGLNRSWQRPFDLVLLDLALPDGTAWNSRGSARAATALAGHHDHRLRHGGERGAGDQAGAANFVQKPWDNEKLLADVRAADRAAPRRRREHPTQARAEAALHFENIVGKSEPMLRMFDLVAQVAPSRSTVLLQGESGTGKELIAKAIHANSPRKRPAVRPGEHRLDADRTAGIDPVRAREGRIHQRDRIEEGLVRSCRQGHDLPRRNRHHGHGDAGKILRVLQDRKFMQLGGIHEMQVDVRIIAATNVDLRQTGARRQVPRRLYYRLNVIKIELPPLRAAQGRYSAAGGPLPEEVFRGERTAALPAHHAGGAAAADGVRVAGKRARTGERDRAGGGAVLRRQISGPIFCRTRSSAAAPPVP